MSRQNCRIVYLLLYISITLLLSGCRLQTPPPPLTADEISSNSAESSLVNETIPSFGISLEEYNCPIEFPSDEECIEIATKIFEGNLIVHDTISEALIYTPTNLANFDWEIQFTSSPNTFQLYLQCLNPIAYLTKAYELTGDTEKLILAQEFLESWIAYKDSYPENNPFLWYDHGTALRAENLIYFALVLEDSGLCNNEFREMINTLLSEHGEFLANPDNYTKNHNHGIFQDRALIYIAFFLNNDQSDEWLSLAKERVKEQHDFAFNEEQAHVENSPGYAIVVMDMFRGIGLFLNQFEDPFSEELCSNIQESAEFMTWLIKPNGFIAENGDTNSDACDLSYFGNDQLTYASSLGKQGIIPSLNATVYPETGYLFSRPSWGLENFSDATWCLFKAGYSSNTHKHADDCSFMLYSKGYDIFVDPGWYNYMSGNKYRDYFISSKAHNTVIVDDKTYSPTVENSIKTGIIDYQLSEKYNYALGFNDMYSGVKIDRHFYTAGDAIILYDDIVSETEHVYTQLFHLSEYMKLIDHNDTETILSLADTEYIVRIRQLGNILPSLEVIEGTDTTEYGHISRSLNTLDTTTTLKYNLNCSTGSFITLITIEDENGLVQLTPNSNEDESMTKSSEIIYNNVEQTISLNGTTIYLRSRERFDADNVIYEIDGTKLIAENLTLRDDLTYAYYLIDKQSATVIQKTEYTPNPIFSCEVPPGEFLLKSYVKSCDGQRKSSIVANIINDSEGDSLIVKDGSTYNLTYNGHNMEPLNESTYKFTVDFDYVWDFNIKWYIYRNGGYYTLINSSEKELIYTFDEPGNYTVMYYLTTLNGDNEFWNFPQIEIENSDL